MRREHKPFLILAVLGVWGVVLIADSADALASCGDYLANHSTMDASHSVPKPIDGTGDQPMRPCQGANCQRGSLPMPTAPTDPPTLQIEEFAHSVHSVDVETDGASASLQSTQSLCFNGFRLRIDRPPQG